MVSVLILTGCVFLRYVIHVTLFVISGWTSVVQLGQTYKMVFENVEHIVNMSYSAGFYDMQDGGVVITHNVSSKPDRVYTSKGRMREISETKGGALSYETNVHGDFFFDENVKELSYLGKWNTYLARIL